VAFIDLFSEGSAAYATARPTYPAGLFTRLAALAPGRSRAWDCATGSGQAALGLARWFDRVDATDASAAQIEHALPHERVHYSVAPAEASGLAERSVELISVAQALHWFDHARFYEEARRVLKPQGVLAAYGYSWFYVSPEIDAIVDEDLLRPLVGHWGAANQLLWDGYRTIPFPFDELNPPRMAIHVRWNLQQILSYYSTWSASAVLIKSEGDDFLVRARRRLADAWGDPDQQRPIIMPMTIRIGRLGAAAN
jgi:SAM-dependent methyltransferase